MDQSSGCVAPDERGRPCDNRTLPDAPFPICGKHATQVMAFVRLAMRRRAGARDEPPPMMTFAGITDEQRAELNKVLPAPPPRPAPRDRVYYLRVGDLIKIGYTSQMDIRMKHYPPGSELLATEIGGPDLEARRLGQFREYRRAGREWHYAGESLMDHIANLTS